MNKKIIVAVIVSVFTMVLLYGCADSISNPTNAGNGTINIAVYKPLANDTISYKGQDVIYDVTIDQGFKLLEIYINGVFVKNFILNASGAKPAVSILLDSTWIDKRISYQLKYYDADGKYIEGPVISNILVSEDRTPPYQPFGVSLLKISPSSYNITWEDTSSGQVAHEIWRKASSASDFSLYLTVAPGAYNTNDENVDPNLIFYYKVRGVNKYGYSTFSNIVNTIGVGGSVNLPAPTLISVIATNTTVVKLNWQINSTAQNYFKIERKSNYISYDVVGIVSKNSNTFTDSLNGLVPGGQYWYRIKAVSGSDSSWSNEVLVTTPYNMLVPPVLTSLTNPSAGKVTLKYNVNNTPWADFCLIERKTSTNGTWGQIVQLESWITTYDDTTVQTGNTYYYRIRKYDVSGVRYSDYSNEMSLYVSQK